MNATAEIRGARLEKRSAITPSLDQETREQRHRQPQHIREKQTRS